VQWLCKQRANEQKKKVVNSVTHKGKKRKEKKQHAQKLAKPKKKGVLLTRALAGVSLVQQRVPRATALPSGE
jgi:hypothetical protein